MILLTIFKSHPPDVKASRKTSIMKRSPKIGEVGELSFVVDEQHIIDFADNEMPPVLSTPWLIWFLEHSARAAVLPVLEAGESTVGIHVDVEHLAPTPPGKQVTCRSRVIHTDGRTITFQMEAEDGYERIARGIHRLRIIRCDRFRQRIQAKS
ncbi:MAG TPA: thioesterase [Planctomycetaceae bacterium]|nr:thioesterase [Blastopirellula sp.]HAY81692.1 thioesterase [Planctomycetaceae bacterium]